MQFISSDINEFSNNVIFTKTILSQFRHQNFCCENVEGLYFFFDFVLFVWANICRKFRFIHLNCVCHRTKFSDFEFWPRSLLWLKNWWWWCDWWWKHDEKKQKNFCDQFATWKNQKFDDECVQILEKKMHKKNKFHCSKLCCHFRFCELIKNDLSISNHDFRVDVDFSVWVFQPMPNYYLCLLISQIHVDLFRYLCYHFNLIVILVRKFRSKFCISMFFNNI